MIQQTGSTARGIALLKQEQNQTGWHKRQEAREKPGDIGSQRGFEQQPEKGTDKKSFDEAEYYKDCYTFLSVSIEKDSSRHIFIQ